MVADLLPYNHQQSASTKSDRKTIMKWQSSMQSQLMKTYLSGLQELVSNMGGEDLWRSSTPNERIDIYSVIWKQDPMGVCRTSLGLTASSIPVSDIFSARSPLHVKWQSFFKTVFVWMCENTFSLRILKTDKNSKEQCFRRYRFMVNNPVFTNMDLGGRDDFPVKRPAVE